MSYEKIYQISFAIAFIIALPLFQSNSKQLSIVYSAKNEAKVHTGVLETKEDGKENLSKTIQTIGNKIAGTQSFVSVAGNNIQKKTIEKSENTVKSVKNIEQVKSYEKSRTPKQIYDQVKHLGYREAPTVSIISTCKTSSLDPRHCILVALTLMYNEAGNQQNSKACVDRNNCFGIQSGKKNYSSLDEGMENWVQKYNRYWINAEGPEFFYSKSGQLPRSRYCTSENSSGSEVGCPRGLLIASQKWNQLKSIIY